jgi:uncharacterized protein with von Willebrand factor type A (vWA) domain
VRIQFEDNWATSRSELLVGFADGSTAEARHDSGIPAADVAAQGRRIEAKFLSLVTPILGAPRARNLMAMVAGLDELRSVAELTALAQG